MECYFEYNNKKKHSYSHHFGTDEYVYDILILASFSPGGHFCENYVLCGVASFANWKSMVYSNFWLIKIVS